MSTRVAIAVASLGVLLTGCEHPENYRWSSESHPDFSVKAPPPSPTKFNWDGPSVSVYSYPTPAVAQAALSIKDLSDRGQAALIEALAKARGDSSKLPVILSKPLGQTDAQSEGAASVDESFNRTLVATVAEGLDAGPADRLAWTWIDIRPENFLFFGYTIAATDNETLNIESVQNQTTASLQGQFGTTTSNTNAATNMTAPPSATGGTTVGDVLTKVFGTSAGATANLSNQYTTSATINQQYEKLHIDIVPEELRIYRGSERNLDVTGNTLVALTATVNPDQWKTPEIQVQRVTKLVLTKSGAMLSPKKIDIEVNLEKAPPHCPLIANVTLIYERRKVADARSYVEGEQNPDYEQNSVSTSDVTIVPADDVRKASWQIYGPSQVIKLNDSFGQLQPLDFPTYEQARDLAAWMNAQPRWVAAPGQHKFGALGYGLSSGGLPQLEKGPYYAKRVVDDPVKVAKECTAMMLPPN